MTALLIIDPLLAETAAFRLSVAASTGIAVLEPTIRDALPGPTALRGPLAVTLAAQLAVAPVLMTTFGPMSVISLPANVLAGPIAGAVMAWGMTAGVLAGIVPLLAAPIHLVTRVLLWLLERIAATAADVPISSIGLDWVAVAVVVAAGRAWWRVVPGGRVVAAVTVAVLAAQLRPAPTTGVHPVGNDSTLTVVGDTVSLRLGDEFRPVDLITDLRDLGVRSVDVVETDNAARVEPALAGRIDVGRVVANG